MIESEEMKCQTGDRKAAFAVEEEVPGVENLLLHVQRGKTSRSEHPSVLAGGSRLAKAPENNEPC